MSHFPGRNGYVTSSVLVLIALILPTAEAGSPQEPEIVDAADDVETPILSPPGAGNSHVDLLAGWLFVDDPGKELVVVIQVKDARPLESPQPNWQVNTTFSMNVTAADVPNGMVEFSWTTQGQPAGKIGSRVEWSVADPIGTQRLLDHSFMFAFQERGVGTFRVPVALVEKYGDTATNFGLKSHTFFSPDSGGPPTPSIYRDVAYANASVAPFALRWTPQNGNASDESASTTAAAPATSVTERERSPALPVGIVLLLVMMATVLLRRMRPR